VRVESSPLGAEVRLDGEVRGETPLTLEQLNGDKTYEVELQREGYQVETREMTPSEASEPLDVKLESSDGVLKISSYPSDAEILVDGESVGYTPVTAANIRRGESHRVVARLNGEEVEREVDWEKDEPPVKEVQLEFEGQKEADRDEERAERGGGRGAGAARAGRRSAGRGSSGRSGTGGGGSESSDDSSSTELNLFDDSEEESKSKGSSRGASASGGSNRKASGSESGENSGEEGSSEDLDIWGSDEGGEEVSSSSSGGGESAGNGYLSVQVKKGWGKVYVDGQKVASETPLINHSLGPGTHEVKVYYPVLKRSSDVRTVQVESGKTERVIFDP
jgi:hypothetical protein